MRLLDGDTALVTGAAGGIGRGIAAALEDESATVFGADLAQADLSRPGGFQAPQAMVDKIALRRFGTPADVAAMAIAVLSERFGAYVTGATIAVDGGIALHNWIDP